MGQTQSVFGNKPNFKGLEKYVLERHVSNSIKPWKELLHAQKHIPGQGLKIFIAILGPMILIIGLICSFTALYLSTNATRGYGLQNILVDSTISSGDIPLGSEKYQVDASSTAKVQLFSLRAGEWGRNDIITLTLPNANLMKEDGSVIYVRNTSIETITSDNQVSLTIPNIKVTAGSQGIITIPARQNYNFINSNDLNGVPKWYPALLMDGV